MNARIILTSITFKFKTLFQLPLSRGKRQVLALIYLSFFASFSIAQETIKVSGQENGLVQQGKIKVWQDELSKSSLSEAHEAYIADQYTLFEKNNSTGLMEGALWSHFYLENITDSPITLHLEYVDHQVITLAAYSRVADSSQSFEQIADLSLKEPFSHRPFKHIRFVMETKLEPGQTYEYMVKFGSEGSGYIFPNLRIWSPDNLRSTQIKEALGMAFWIGGFFLMSTFSFIAGIATREKFFYAYSVYALSKTIAWITIFGYTHQFIITQNFHWSYISISGSVSIFFGILFSRLFLQTAKYTPRTDYIMLFMMANTGFLFLVALLKLKALAIISITLALLMYPVLFIAALNRWFQGSKESAVFAVAWSFLAAGMVVQALRDLGFVEHNFLNYYWPPLASYTEMVVIMVAMGLKVRLLRKQKIAAERKYRQELEQSKERLEILVKERTRDLEQEKVKAQLEACTDSLTGTRNRRSFFAESEKLLQESKMRDFSVSLLMFDIDHFKRINDTYGHAIGDEALRVFTKVIAEKIRGTDIFGRLGGEEFSLLLCGTKEHALQMAERLRKDISDIQIDTPKGPLQFTTSIGIAHLCKEAVIEELLNDADKALYVAKEAGRNKIIEYPSI
ncbi:diguanylate cyclase [Alteromonadaceae bacterium M269]|nr:diguanylate cyclase [Alteromonadaceae bacterium M269]